MPTAICANESCGQEVFYRNTRGSSIASMTCPKCGGSLRGKGVGAMKRGRCVACDRLCESTVPEIGQPAAVYKITSLAEPEEKVCDVVAGDHVCYRHHLRGACGCDLTLSWRDRAGRFLPRILYRGVEPCPVHGGEPVLRGTQ